MNYKGKKSKLKTALVLSGGGSRGAFEAGALKIILNKIIPDVVIGTSVGSLNGAGVALGMSTEEIEQRWISMIKNDIFPLNKEIFYKFYLAKSIYSNHKFKKWLESFLGGKLFKDCKIPLYINVTKLKNGEGVFLHKGNIVDAIMASSAIPPLFPPYVINGTQYVDGGLSNYIGTEEAIQLQCKQVIIINLGYNAKSVYYDTGLLKLANHTIELLSHQALKKEIELCKHDNVVIIQPKKQFHTKLTDFSQTKKLIQKGEKAAQKTLRKIIM